MPQAHASWVNLAATIQAPHHGGGLEAMAGGDDVSTPVTRRLAPKPPPHVTGMWGAPWDESLPERHRPPSLTGRGCCTSPQASTSNTRFLFSTRIPCLSEAHSGAEAEAEVGEATAVDEAAVVAVLKREVQAAKQSGPRKKTFLT
jgi:hypothetical protein